jgi:hypothetical protein
VIWRRKKQPLVSRAIIPTITPERYAKQLVAHLGRKAPVTETPDGTRLGLGRGRGLVTTGDGVLILTAQADTASELSGVQDVLARHLERFATRSELTVTWSPAEPA